ncbi:DUF1524 domain-containing protein [Frankia sp. AgPm24]|uniref:GmrSD restriction endonuclease domain-containing protein n=1 Tax=Frankia sp. AgPm24 TaxID=631128 RepID=UPI00200D2130|nr:DUF1524 domain-containing protein [Frankia sp. AgPm24]MCK9921878.1 DUF1524 domain-containing protein [Frankia sp. AgPm24]
MRLPTRADHIYDWQWFPMQSLIGEHLEDLIWLDLVIRGDSKATKSGIYHAQQRHLSKLPSEHSIAEWIAELHFKAKIFSKILDPEQEADPNLRMALDRLRRWGSDVVHPIALKILIAHAAERMDTDEAIAALRMAESYLVRRMIVGTSSAGSNIISALLVKELGDATPTADAIRRALSGPRRKFPTDQQIRDAAIASPFYWYGRGPQRTYVLRCLEEDYGHEEPPDWEAKFTVEHILPQTINREEWRETLAEDAREGETIDEVHRSLVHTIGNLTLTGSNPKLADREFTEKKKLLMDSGLAMNREIAVSDRWGREEVHNRGRMLAERITRIWPGPEDQAAIAPSPTLDWPILTQVLSSIPAGRWTSYSDVAEVVGTSAHVVGRWLPSRAVPNAHRVLMLNGSIPSSIRWPDPQRTDDPRTVLQQEGVTLEASGRAVAHLRMSSSDLARACDMYTPDDEDNSNREFLLFDS